jgi:hypothetical protein
MKDQKKNSNTEKKKKLERGNVEIRPDLEDPSKGKDLSYLNEFPQFSSDEGVKAGVPPPKDEET